MDIWHSQQSTNIRWYTLDCRMRFKSLSICKHSDAKMVSDEHAHDHQSKLDGRCAGEYTMDNGLTIFLGQYLSTSTTRAAAAKSTILIA